MKLDTGVCECTTSTKICKRSSSDECLTTRYIIDESDVESETESELVL